MALVDNETLRRRTVHIEKIIYHYLAPYITLPTDRLERERIEKAGRAFAAQLAHYNPLPTENHNGKPRRPDTVGHHTLP